MKPFTRIIGTGLFVWTLVTPVFAHSEHVPVGDLEHLFSGMHHLLPIIAVAAVITVLLRYRQLRTDRGTRLRGWFPRRRR